MALDGNIFVAYPDYSVSLNGSSGVETGRRANLGHAMAVAVDSSGQTRGSEYGRYKSNEGNAQRVTVPNIKMKGTHPTDAELEAYGKQLLASYKKLHPNAGDEIIVKYVPGEEGDYEKTVKTMSDAEKRGLGINYNLLTCITCGSYAKNIVNQTPVSDHHIGTPKMIS